MDVSRGESLHSGARVQVDTRMHTRLYTDFILVDERRQA